MTNRAFADTSKSITAILWGLLGLFLVWQGVSEVVTLLHDSYYDSFASAKWYVPWFVSGALVLLGGCVIWFDFRKLRVFLLGLCWIQIAYGFAYTFFGPEGSFLYTKVAPSLVVALSLWTIYNVNRWLVVR